MKTPLQELIEKLKESLIGSEFEANRTAESVYINKAIDLATELLTKERLAYIDTFDEGWHASIDNVLEYDENSIKWFNKTFNQ